MVNVLLKTEDKRTCEETNLATHFVQKTQSNTIIKVKLLEE